ncbi:MAG: hypothetical protein LBM02_02430 [Lachnospiraceae bacterium]|jgi:glucan-binding YG repeat protein|nr:hypothetical protein [Lachnospiraceae bacterium]
MNKFIKCKRVLGLLIVAAVFYGIFIFNSVQIKAADSSDVTMKIVNNGSLDAKASDSSDIKTDTIENSDNEEETTENSTNEAETTETKNLKYQDGHYYFSTIVNGVENDRLLKGLEYVDGRYYIFNSSGTGYYKNTFVKACNTGKYYMVDGSGLIYKNKFNYFSKCKDYRYFGANGAMVSGITKINNHIYYFNKSGLMYRKGNLKIGSNYYYFKTGALKKGGGTAYAGWKTFVIKHKKYYRYYSGNGKALRYLYKNSKGVYYYFNKYGYVIRNKTLKLKTGLYRFGKNGKGIRRELVSGYIHGKKIYYINFLKVDFRAIGKQKPQACGIYAMGYAYMVEKEKIYTGKSLYRKFSAGGAACNFANTKVKVYATSKKGVAQRNKDIYRYITKYHKPVIVTMHGISTYSFGHNHFATVIGYRGDINKKNPQWDKFVILDPNTGKMEMMSDIVKYARNPMGSSYGVKMYGLR